VTLDREAELIATIERHAVDLLGTSNRAEQALVRKRDSLIQLRERELDELRTEQARHSASMQARAEAHHAELRRRLDGVSLDHGLSSMAWADGAWETFRPAFDVPVPRWTRIGTWSVKLGTDRVDSPALVPLIGGQNLLIEAGGEAKKAAADAVRSVLLRLLATLDPGKLRFLFIDPVGLGQNVAGFLHLMDVNENLTSGKPWTEPNHIEHQLLEITDHMERVIQRFFRGSEQSMEEYNRTAGEIAEPYRLVTVLNFPANFTEAAARRLVSIATHGPRCGVYVVGTLDRDIAPPHGFNPADLRSAAHLIVEQQGNFRWPAANMASAVQLDLDQPPQADAFKLIVTSVGERARDLRVEVPFERVAILADDQWKSSTAGGIATPIGKAGNKLLEFRLGHDQEQVHQALVAGRPGSGKSNLLHVLVTNLALQYGPDELELYLIDMKKGVEFKVYADFPLPQVRVLAIGSEREFALSVLQRLDDEMELRGRTFTRAGTNDLPSYRRIRGEKLARILLIIDEFQELFAEEDALSSRAANLLERLVRLGRGFGIHLVLASQTLASHTKTLPRSTIGLIKLRIAFDCSEADSRMILSDENRAASTLSRAGEAIYNSAGGVPGKGNETLFQTAYLSHERRKEFARHIGSLAGVHGVDGRDSVVFEHDRSVRLEEARAIRELTAVSQWPEPPAAPRIWLGEPVAIQPSTHAPLRRQPGSNLLIMGRDEESGVALLASAVVSLAGQLRPGSAEVFILKLVTADSDWAGIGSRLKQELPLEILEIPPRTIADAIDRIHRALERRAEEDSAWTPPIFLVIPGLHRARDLHRDDTGYSSSESDGSHPARQLQRIVRDGPELGIHVLAWCDTWANFSRVGDRGILRAFDLRVALPMTNEDSNALLDDHVASRLGPNRAYFVDLQQGTDLQKFRPFAMPDADWMTAFGQALRRRT
jgi:DNA segregation ATPase FtsK/SpoIIIE, S-DNA-T family